VATVGEAKIRRAQRADAGVRPRRRRAVALVGDAEAPSSWKRNSSSPPFDVTHVGVFGSTEITARHCHDARMTSCSRASPIRLPG
jgi:hypothetical protein